MTQPVPAKHAADHGGEHEHAHGTGRYWAVWAALIAFTLITVVTGKMDFGAANIWLAMLIATVKATLVVLFFMHLWDEGAVNRMVFVTSVVFLFTLLLGVFGDLVFRLNGALPNGGPLPDHVPAAGEHAPGGEHAPKH